MDSSQLLSVPDISCSSPELMAFVFRWVSVNGLLVDAKEKGCTPHYLYKSQRSRAFISIKLVPSDALSSFLLPALEPLVHGMSPLLTTNTNRRNNLVDIEGSTEPCKFTEA